jgi:hypothetical protein
MLVMAIPLVNIVMVLVWAFTGDNKSRNDYFKAVIVVFCLNTGLAVFLLSPGMFSATIDKFGLLPK